MQDLTETEIAKRIATWNAAGSHQRARGDPAMDFPQLRQLIGGEPRPAAVLIPLLRQDSSWSLLLTRRNDALPEHSGQVAFPGGRSGADDRSPEDTALREAEEEIGLHPSDVRILGSLPDYLTITNYIVTPIIGAIPWPYPLHPAADEVIRIFTIPLPWLADPANHEERLRPLPEPFPPAPVIYFHAYDGEVLWGASARFTLALIEALMD